MENTFNFDDVNLNSTNPGSYSGNSKAFKCPFCKGFASHIVFGSLKHESTVNVAYDFKLEDIVIRAQCVACNKDSIWLKSLNTHGYNGLSFEKLIHPNLNPEIDPPNPDMPSKVMNIYNEAALVIKDSSRASAALARLAIEILVNDIEKEGNNLNQKIGNLVNKGLSEQIQKALDSVRIIGNNAVHPGEIIIDDNFELAKSLLMLVNIIVEELISRPKKINEIYNMLPQTAHKAIEKRDRASDMH